ncbi:MAG: ABC transporter permease subunit [Fimbriimonadaceae bacterium]|nr:MAG: ABC transporter permease subunit [Fimbriimonadaceae bacterium]
MSFIENIVNRIPNKPMFFEVRQQLRRSSLESATGGSNKLGSIIGVIILLLIVGSNLIMSARYIQVGYLMFILPVLATFLLPAMVSPVIAGEFQRRSLEQLLAAPLSSLDIVKGKALRAVVPVLMMLAVVFLMILLIGVGKIFQGHEPENGVVSPFISLPVSTILFFVWSYFVTGLTVFISSVTKSTSAALLASVGILVGLVFVVPAIIIPLSTVVFGPTVIGYLAAMHPAGMVAFAVLRDNSPEPISLPAVIAILVVSNCIYLAFGTLFLNLSAKKLGTYRKTGFEN